MNAKIYCISDNILLGRENCSSINYLSKILFSKGVRIDQSLILPSTFQIEQLNSDKLEGKQNIFIYLTDSQQTFCNISNHICSKLNLSTSVSNVAKEVIQSRFSKQNLPLSNVTELCWQVPEGSYVLGNIFGDIQFVMTKSQNDFYLIMPSNFNELQYGLLKILDNVIIDNKYQQTQVFKTFGLTEQNIKDILKDLIKNKDKISICVYSSNLDIEIIIRSKNEQNIFNEYVGKVFSRLSKYIYAEEDISMEQTLIKLLTTNNLKLSLCEQITQGNIASKLFGEQNEENNISSSITFVNPNEINQAISVKHSTIQNFGPISVESIYELTSNVLCQSQADIVCSTLGKYESGVASCFIAVGDKNSIHVYKNNFIDNMKNIVDDATKASLFYLIKKLRKNDFHFDKKIV